VAPLLSFTVERLVKGYWGGVFGSAPAPTTIGSRFGTINSMAP